MAQSWKKKKYKVSNFRGRVIINVAEGLKIGAAMF